MKFRRKKQKDMSVDGYNVESRCEAIEKTIEMLVKNGSRQKKPRFVDMFHNTDEERLVYYRSHGLADCSDYPGGDAQFEKDVLSGKHHMRDLAEGSLLREDQYVYDKMYDGTFLFDSNFLYFVIHPLFIIAYYDICYQHGVYAFPPHPPIAEYCRGGYTKFRNDVLSGKYVHDVLHGTVDTMKYPKSTCQKHIVEIKCLG